MVQLNGRIALVAGATRGAGRGIAVALGEAGSTVYCTGRSSRAEARPPRADGVSPFATESRPETIEETAELVTAAGGHGIAVRVDHTDEAQVEALAERIAADHGRLDILVNDIWGGDAIAQWGKKLWQVDIAQGRALFDRAVMTHVITSRYCVPLVQRSDHGLIIEITDGDSMAYRGALFYDLVKSSVIRFAFAQAEELASHGVAVLALTPGFLRSEAMLEQFGVGADNWRDGAEQDPHFAYSETPALVGRAVAALAADPDILARSGTVTSSWHEARRYGLTDADGTRPDWGAHASIDPLFASYADSHYRFRDGFAAYERGALTSQDHTSIESISSYWFGELDGVDDVDASKQQLWWQGGDEVDAEIRSRFGHLVERALAGELDHWKASPRGSLALVILLDQFTRNLGRGTPDAFAGDDRALAACFEAIEAGHDQKLRLVERGFLYMPMMHAEDRDVASRCVNTYAALGAEIAACGKQDQLDFHDHALGHAKIVERFGRYPHRNAILGREPTAEEEQFLADGGPNFGQRKS